MQPNPTKSLLDSISLKDIPTILPALSPSEQERLLAELDKLADLKKQKLCQEKFLAFVNAVWPTFISGRHHAKMAEAFERVAAGKCKRLIINMPPRHTKSEFASYLLPAWFLGKYPHKKVIQTSHTAELAVGFGRKVRNLVDTEVYHDIFPDLQLQADSKAAGRWNTSKQGDYFAIGVGGAVTGKGADLLIIDDPHSEQEAALAEVNPDIYDKTYEWYTSGPRQRLQPGGAICVVMTRWSKRDLTGQVLKSAAQRGGEDWEVIEFPAILPSGNPLWPEFWALEELEALREELPNPKWMAQYQQNPVSESSAIIKRDWWRTWESDTPPQCDFILMSWDTAFEKTQRADYSALTTWGVFHQPDDTGTVQTNIILLNAFRERMEFPRLKQAALNHYKDWKPDSIIIEKKASGAPLIYEMRAMGIPVQEFTPNKGNDKISRLNAVADLFASGRVWAPNTHWAEEVIEEVASFPSGEHDDYCLVAGSKIWMADGVQLGIERVVVGDWVMTPIGPCQVTAAGQTGVKPTRTIEMDSGAALTLTDNHPVATREGWKKAGDINRDDAIITLSTNQRVSSWGSNHPKPTSRKWCSTGIHTIGTQILLIARTGCILLGQGLYSIVRYGYSIMGQFLMGITSTIETGTLQTTGSRIWNVCPVNNIGSTTHQINVGRVRGRSNLNILLRYVRYLLAGIVRLRAWSGIKNMQKTPSTRLTSLHGGKLGRWSLKFVRYVEGHLNAGTQGVAYVPSSAMMPSTGQNKEQKNSPPQNSVGHVGGSSIPCTLSNGFVHQNVSVSTITRNKESVPVYNLTVDKAHCYYANGVLTHNCDSTSLALMRMRLGGFVSTELDEPEPVRQFKSLKHRGYY